MKRTALKKKSNTSISVLQRLIWEECRRIIKNRYGDVCYTCGRCPLEGKNRHTGHFLPKGSLSAYLKYDLRLLRPQCYNCNINLGGNGAEFYKRMVEKEGQAYVDKIFADRIVSVKAMDHYLKIFEEYKTVEN